MNRKPQPHYKGKGVAVATQPPSFPNPQPLPQAFAVAECHPEHAHAFRRTHQCY